jgi:integrase
MPTQKKSRSPFGNIRKQKTRQMGLIVTVYDARKRYHCADGTRKEKFKRCATHSEAQIALQNFNNEIRAELRGAREEKTNPKQKTFLDLTAYFRREYLVAAKIVAGRIIEGYRQDLKKLSNQIDDFENFFGAIPLGELSYERIRQYKIAVSLAPQKNTYKNEPPKAATVNRKLAMLKRIVKVGVQLGWITVNPFLAGKPLVETRAENTRSRILTFEEERRLIEACLSDDEIDTLRHGKPLKMIFEQPRAHILLPVVMALDTAMRKGEIFAIEKGQIDLDKKVLHLRAEQTKAFVARTMPISERLEKLLRGHLEKHSELGEKDKLLGGIKNCRSGFETAKRRAGISDFNFHDLRHTAISWFNEAGVSDMVKRKIAGHSSADIHEKYHSLSEDILDEARIKINEFRRKIDQSLLRSANAKPNQKEAA